MSRLSRRKIIAQWSLLGSVVAGLALFLGRPFFGRLKQTGEKMGAEAKPKSKSVIRTAGAPTEHWVGDGFFVSTMFSVSRDGPETISPFLLMDYGAPRRFEPTSVRRGVGEHPHRGFETVTFAYQGEIQHRDSSGGGGIIGPGDVQWMTAASGLVHEEKHSAAFAAAGGELEMVQLWVNLPARLKMTQPRYQELLNQQFPRVPIEGGVATARLIAGHLAGQTGPAMTHTPMQVFDLDFSEAGNATFDLEAASNTLFLVLRGSVELDGGARLQSRSLAVLSREGERVSFAGEAGTRILILSGTPIDEPVAAYGPFVMNTPEEIRQAVADYQAGRMGRLDDEA